MSRGLYSSPYFSPYLSANGGGAPVVLLAVGDSWVSGLTSALELAMPNLTLDNYATSAEKLYGANQIMADLTARLASPLYEYDTAIVEGGTNDWEDAPTTFTLQQWKDAYVTMIDQCFAAGIENVCAVGSLPLADVWDAGAASNIWKTMVAANTSIPAIWLEFDAWLEAYCEAVGAKFINLNQLPFAEDQWPEPGMSFLAHPADPAGWLILANSIYKPVLNAATPAVTNAVTVMRDRPNKGLLTIADMTRITDVVTALDAEWDQAVEVWLLDQSDVSADGNALTGLITGEVLLPRSGTAGTTVQTVTRNNTAGNEGVIVAATHYLRQGIGPTQLGRTFAAGAVFQARTSNVDSILFGITEGFGDTSFDVRTIETGGILAGYGLNDSTSVSSVVGAPADQLGKCLEMRTAQSGSNQINTLYTSGVAVDSGTTNALTQAYGGSASTRGISLNGFVYSAAPNYQATAGGPNTISAFYITDGTTTASLWASALE